MDVPEVFKNYHVSSWSCFSARLIFFFFFGFIMMVRVPAVMGTELYIPALKGKSGQIIDIPIMIDKVDNLAGVKLVLKYDPKILTYKKAAKTEQTSSLMHIVNDKKPGRLIVVMAGPKGIKGKEFSIISLTFEAKKGLKSNHTTAIKITELQLMSDQLKNIKSKVRVSPITITP
jgi:hypothetical protein